MRTVKDRGNGEWLELCEYVKREILEYDENMKFPKYLALKLQGLKRGQHIANNNIELHAGYDDKTLLYAFKLYKQYIVTYLHENKKRIKNEQHKINLIIKMIEPKLNDVYLRLQQIEQLKSKAAQASFENQSNVSANYVKQTKEVHTKLKNLF